MKCYVKKSMLPHQQIPIPGHCDDHIIDPPSVYEMELIDQTLGFQYLVETRGNPILMNSIDQMFRESVELEKQYDKSVEVHHGNKTTDSLEEVLLLEDQFSRAAYDEISFSLSVIKAMKKEISAMEQEAKIIERKKLKLKKKINELKNNR